MKDKEKKGDYILTRLTSKQKSKMGYYAELCNISLSEYVRHASLAGRFYLKRIENLRAMKARSEFMNWPENVHKGIYYSISIKPFRTHFTEEIKLEGELHASYDINEVALGEFYSMAELIEDILDMGGREVYDDRIPFFTHIKYDEFYQPEEWYEFADLSDLPVDEGELIKFAEEDIAHAISERKYIGEVEDLVNYLKKQREK